MYYKLNEKEKEMMKKVEKITLTDYELLGDFIPVDSLVSAISDLLYEIDYLNEKLEDEERKKVFGEY